MRALSFLVLSVILFPFSSLAAPLSTSSDVALIATPTPTPISATKILFPTSLGSPTAVTIATFGSNISGNFTGGGLFELTGLTPTGTPGLGILNLGSDQNRWAVDLASNREIWRQSRSNQDECALNMASTVKRVGPYIVVGWPYYSNQWGGNVNGLGKVCIYDGTTGDFLNSTVGYNQGELFGQQIEEIKDSQNPNRYLIAVAAPRRWSARLNLTVGGVDIFDIQDILSNGFFATPITSIQGFERRTSAMPGFENQICDNSELGTAVANAGDLNNDGIEDLIVTDPNYRCGNTNYGYRGVLFVFDTRRVGSADIVFSFRNELLLGYNSSVNSLRVGHSATTFKTANRTIALVSGSNLFISGRWYSGTLIVGVKESGVTRLTIKGRLGRSVVNQYREGWTLTNVGDVNGDGIDDIASGNPAPGTPNSRVEFFSGAAIMGANSTTVVPPFSNFYTDTPNSLLGYGVNSVIGISDMDGDGKNEVALGAMGDSLVHIVRP